MSNMKNLSLTGYFAVMIFLLCGCANTSTIRADVSRINGTKVYLIPTGIVKIGCLRDTIGAGFGAIGSLVEHAASADQRNKVATRVATFLTPDTILKLASDEVEYDLRSRTAPYAIIDLPTNEPQAPFNEWFNPDTLTLVPAVAKTSKSIVIDYGFGFLAIHKYILGTYAEGAFGIRIIDPLSGHVVARARTFVVGYIAGGEKISEDVFDLDAPGYNEVIEAAFGKLIKRLVNEAIDKAVTSPT